MEHIGNYTENAEEQGRWYIRPAKKYIADHFRENIMLADVANMLHITPVYLSTIFKKEEGQNFSEYIIQYRMNIAKELLKKPEYSISQVGDMVG